MTGTTETLLSPWFPTTTTHLGASLGGVGTGAGGGELSGDDLVHHGFVRLDTEDVGTEVDLTRAGTVCRIELCG